MYNRYIPQPDGSYRKNTVQDPPPPLPQEAPQEPREEIPCPPPAPPSVPKPEPPKKHSPPKTAPAGDFLRNLIPRGLDTGDLLVILLLLLMAGDRAEDKNTALLTLALYLFM